MPRDLNRCALRLFTKTCPRMCGAPGKVALTEQ
jgi:hypothetical protein